MSSGAITSGGGATGTVVSGDEEASVVVVVSSLLVQATRTSRSEMKTVPYVCRKRDMLPSLDIAWLVTAMFGHQRVVIVGPNDSLEGAHNP